MAARPQPDRSSSDRERREHSPPLDVWQPPDPFTYQAAASERQLLLKRIQRCASAYVYEHSPVFLPNLERALADYERLRAMARERAWNW